MHIYREEIWLEGEREQEIGERDFRRNREDEEGLGGREKVDVRERGWQGGRKRKDRKERVQERGREGEERRGDSMKAS